MIDLMLGDCLERMKEIPDGSVDMILCDLPYGTTQNKWDSVIPLDPLWGQYKRIIKANGAIVLTASQPFTSALVMSNSRMFKQELVWDKVAPRGFLNAKRMHLTRHESILVFYNKPPTYNPLMETRGKPRNKGSYNKRSGNGDGCYGAFKNQSTFNNKYYPTSVLRFSNAVQAGKAHPTQKPVALMEYLIRTYTQEDETVLDNCAGSMTTAIACINTNRKGIMIEKDEHYFKVGSERVALALSERGD